MYGVGDSESQANSRESNISFSSTVMHPDMLKSRELMDSDPYHHQQHQYQHHQQQGSALTRYCSAPSSFFASLMEDDFLNRQSSSESEAIFATLVSPDGSGGDSESHDLLYPTDIKHETPEKNQFSICQTSLDHHDLANSVASGTVMENQELGKRSGGGNCSNLIRQSSSPAGFFSALTAENEFGDMRDVGRFRVGNGINGKAGPTNSMNGFINFSSGPSSSSRFMPQITENGNESIEAISQENGHLGNGNSINRFFASSSQNRSSNDSRFSGLKRNRDDEEQNYPGFNASESQNGDSRHYSTGLTHHLSLPKTSAEMAAIEKFLQFQQDSVPCKIRAKRGCATHPRSIAERTRRTRISERMRKLQELFPNMDKQTNTADMLDLAVEYIKDLQKELKTLTDTQAKCTCSTKQKQFPNPLV